MKRECGTCTLCCTLLGVHELQKPPLKDCIHCEVGVGCKIYKQRPGECASFNCLWITEEVPEHLKPDKTHVVLSDLPVDSKVLLVYEDPMYPNAYKQGYMKDYLNSLLSIGVELILIKDGKKQFMKWGTVDQ